MKLLNWGFRNTNTFEISKKNETVFELRYMVRKNKIKASYKGRFFLTINKKDIRNLKVAIQYDGPVVAPVSKNQEIGKLLIKIKMKLLKLYLYMLVKT